AGSLAHVGPVGTPVALIQRVDGRRHVDPVIDGESRANDDQMKRQCQHAHDIVGVGPGTLAAACGPKYEQVAPQPPVGEDTAHQNHQHGKTQYADQPPPDAAGATVIDAQP